MNYYIEFGEENCFESMCRLWVESVSFMDRVCVIYGQSEIPGRMAVASG